MLTPSVETFPSASIEEPLHGWHVLRLSCLEEVIPVVEWVLDAMTGLGYSHRDMFGARLALEEAICNAIKHGHRQDATKAVEVRYTIQPNRFLIEVADEGPGFDPWAVPDATNPENLNRPTGRGLLLMRHYVAWLRYNRKGNCVTMCIYPSGPDSRSSGFPPDR